MADDRSVPEIGAATRGLLVAAGHDPDEPIIAPWGTCEVLRSIGFWAEPDPAGFDADGWHPIEALLGRLEDALRGQIRAMFDDALEATGGDAPAAARLLSRSDEEAAQIEAEIAATMAPGDDDGEF